MDAELLSCGYSFHDQPFHTSYGDSLSFYLFRLQTEGSAFARVNGRMAPVEPGDLLLYRPGDAYELSIREHPEGTGTASGDYYLFCRGKWIDAWWNRQPKATLTRIDLNDDLLILWRLLTLEKRRVEGVDPELTDHLLKALCIHLDRSTTETSAVTSRSFVVLRMKRFIEANAANPFKVRDVTSHVHLSVSRGAHLFKEMQGVSIMRYALSVRLGMAVDRMRYTAMTLEQIAESCGFGSYPYFHRAFKEQFRHSPREYRSLLMARGRD